MNDYSTLPGLLLSQAAPAKVTTWLGRGTVPGYVVPLGGWTAVVPAGASLAVPPYDDALAVLAARPVPGSLRTVLGFVVVEQPEKAVVVIRPRSPRGSARWLAWVPERGAMEVPDHPAANVRDLLAAAGLDDTERDGVLSVLARRDGDCRDLLVDLVAALGLPGGEMLRGTGVPTREDATLVTPGARRVEQFDRDVLEARQIGHELEEGGR